MCSEMKIMLIVGARPNYMKIAPIIRAISAHHRSGAVQMQHLLVHTGQHYGELMSDRFFADLGLPKPDVHLDVGSGSHAAQTAEILRKFEEVVIREWPDFVIVAGDVNSTMACSLATVKLPNSPAKPRPLIAHVESGLRSFDRDMPEEINRIMTDHVSDILFVTEQSGIENLKNEGIATGKVFFVGNTMIDSLLAFEAYADRSDILEKLSLSGDAAHAAIPYALLTLHRPSNVDTREAFEKILEGLRPLAAQMPIVFPVHPRTRKRIEEFGLPIERHENKDGGIRLVEPLGYIDFLALMKHARLVLTDSGGIQEETTCLGVPCVTIRENTERPVTVEHGTNLIAGTSVDGVQRAIAKQMSAASERRRPEKWDGHAAVRIVEVLVRMHGAKEAAAGHPVLQAT